MHLPNFFFREEMTQYDFGPHHPLKPVRLEKTMALLRSLGFSSPVSAEPATREDLLRAHSPEYVEAVMREEPSWEFGLGTGDVPIFAGMHEKSLWYVGGAVAAAKAICSGERLAFNISGGLHHAQQSNASGFCVYNDLAVAISILRETFARVAYIDIDVHHGDGVQKLFYDDPTVLTLSIHESGRTLYPGTGFIDELGAENSSINLPIEAKTTGDVWFAAFALVFPPVMARFKPEVIVLQMGADPHYDDPLGHLSVRVQEWLSAVMLVRKFGVPILASGGGGYNMTTVPRMWAAACLSLAGYEVPREIPQEARETVGATHFFDDEMVGGFGQNLEITESMTTSLLNSAGIG